MSRIYEALQRAEADRQNSNEEPTPRPSTLRAVSVATFDGQEMPFTSTTAATTFSDLVPDLSSFDTTIPVLADVPRRKWSLVMDLFPSLGKRGSSVEQFRSLRSRIQEFRGANTLKSLLISSGLPQEGKSFVATNLAVSLALHKNSKVLLIDADMRRSTLHHYLGCESGPGLADFLASRVGLTEIMQQPNAESTPTDSVARIANNLTFMPAGDAGDKAADLAGNHKFDELIATLAPHFDWIIVDSSPVLPVSDSVGLARACDGVLLVARSAVTTFPVAQRAQEELKASRIIGFVLNGVKKPPVLGNYYGYDGSGE